MGEFVHYLKLGRWLVLEASSSADTQLIHNDNPCQISIMTNMQAFSDNVNYKYIGENKRIQLCSSPHMTPLVCQKIKLILNKVSNVFKYYVKLEISFYNECPKIPKMYKEQGSVIDISRL